MAHLRLELLKEEAKRASSANQLPADNVQPQNVSSSAFFRRAIDIEDRL